MSNAVWHNGACSLRDLFYWDVVACCKYAIWLRIFGISSGEKTEEKLRDDPIKYLKNESSETISTHSPKKFFSQEFRKSQFTLK